MARNTRLQELKNALDRMAEDQFKHMPNSGHSKHYIKVKAADSAKISKGRDNNSVCINGKDIRNNKVPFEFTGLLIGGITNEKEIIHAAMLVRGEFKIDGESESYPFMLVDRWVDGGSIDFFKNKQDALMHIKTRSSNINYVVDCQETVAYQSSAGSVTWVGLIWQDFKVKDFVANFPLPDNQTNCLMFTLRLAAALGHGEDFRKQFQQCYQALTSFHTTEKKAEIEKGVKEIINKFKDVRV